MRRKCRGRIIKRDPLDPVLYALLGEQYANLGKYPEAKSAFQTSVELSDEPFAREFIVLVWLVYFGDYETVERRLRVRNDWNDARSYLYSYMYAVKNELDKVKPEFRDYIGIQLAIHRNQVRKDILKRLEEEIDKGINSYNYLSTFSYLDVYRNTPDFQRILAKAKKNHDRYLAKYGRIEIPE